MLLAFKVSLLPLLELGQNQILCVLMRHQGSKLGKGFWEGELLTGVDAGGSSGPSGIGETRVEACKLGETECGCQLLDAGMGQRGKAKKCLW